MDIVLCIYNFYLYNWHHILLIIPYITFFTHLCFLRCAHGDIYRSSPCLIIAVVVHLKTTPDVFLSDFFPFNFPSLPLWYHERLLTIGNKLRNCWWRGRWVNKVMRFKEGTWCDGHWVLHATDKWVSTPSETNEVLHGG